MPNSSFLSSPQRLLEVRGLFKSFAGLPVLKEIDLQLDEGEVLSIVGENGAGKSTLMKILAGVLSPDGGEFSICGRSLRFATPRDAIEAGVVLIHQELNLCENLNVAQNIFLGREPRRFGFIRSRLMEHQAKTFLQRVGLNLPPRMLVKNLSIGKQQMVEIAKALSTDAKILIFDEPTSSLSAAESESLFRLIEEIKKFGVGILYISHRLSEVRRLSDRVQVLRDGQSIGVVSRNEATHGRLVSMMVGREIANLFQRQRHNLGPTVLEVKNLKTAAHPRQTVSFQVRQGEILGIAGLVGSGRTEVMETLFGVRRPLSGQIRVAGHEVRIDSPRKAIELGLALVPEDRKQHGLLVLMNVRDNIGLPKLKCNQHRFGFVNFSKLQQESLETINRLRVKTLSDRQTAAFLSGGNQQKIVLGKWLTMNPKVLLLDEPTRGIDIGAKQEIYTLIEQLAAQSLAIVCVSSELEEIIGLSDRVLVLREGRISGELRRQEITEESIMRLATN